MYVQRNIETRAFTVVAVEKPISTTYSECVTIDLGIQHAMRMRLIVIYLALQYSFTLSHKQHDFRYIYIYIYIFVKTKCVLIFSTNFD
jgi:hypothetical protein